MPRSHSSAAMAIQTPASPSPILRPSSQAPPAPTSHMKNSAQRTGKTTSPEPFSAGMRTMFEILPDSRKKLIRNSDAGVINEVRVSGGGAKSPVWRQILADVFDVPLVVAEALEGAAYGAALLAGVGGGVWPDVATAAEITVKLGERVEPGAQAGEYADAYQLYRDLYPTLKPAFERLADI